MVPGGFGVKGMRLVLRFGPVPVSEREELVSPDQRPLFNWHERAMARSHLSENRAGRSLAGSLRAELPVQAIRCELL